MASRLGYQEESNDVLIIYIPSVISHILGNKEETNKIHATTQYNPFRKSSNKKDWYLRRMTPLPAYRCKIKSTEASERRVASDTS